MTPRVVEPDRVAAGVADARSSTHQFSRTAFRRVQCCQRHDEGALVWVPFIAVCYFPFTTIRLLDRCLLERRLRRLGGFFGVDVSGCRRLQVGMRPFRAPGRGAWNSTMIPLSLGSL